MYGQSQSANICCSVLYVITMWMMWLYMQRSIKSNTLLVFESTSSFLITLNHRLPTPQRRNASLSVVCLNGSPTHSATILSVAETTQQFWRYAPPGCHSSLDKISCRRRTRAGRAGARPDSQTRFFKLHFEN